MINWGIIGLGSIAHKFAADIQRTENAQLKAVASRSARKAKAFADEHQAERYFSNYEELALDPDIDIIYIATPNTFHFEHTMLCLRQQKSVLCEKPMGVATREVAAMVQEARSHRLFLMEGIWTRFIPAISKLDELLKDGIIGELISVDANFGFKKEFDADSRLFNKELGGGSLLDIGIYPIYLSLLALGFPADIKAMARKAKTGVDTSCEMLFDHPDGSKANLSSTFEANTTNEAFIHGTKGSIKLHAPFHHPEKISIHHSNGKCESLDIPYRGNGYVHEIAAVNECLSQGLTEHPMLSLDKSLELIKIIDKVKECIGLSFDELT